jgi:hypothetical protein
MPPGPDPALLLVGMRAARTVFSAPTRLEMLPAVCADTDTTLSPTLVWLTRWQPTHAHDAVLNAGQDNDGVPTRPLD